MEGRVSPHFKRKEFACQCGCGYDTADAELVSVLEALREALGGRPIIISSGARCPAHNKAIAGSPRSQHLLARAADIVVRGVPADKVADMLDQLYPDSLGVGRYADFTHVDTRKGKARWG